MPQVNTSYNMVLPGGHHREPRNANPELGLSAVSSTNIPNPGNYSPPFFPQLPYTLNGGSGLAKLLFWSVTDGTNGQVLPPLAFNQPVAGSPLFITAWYFPISGPAVPADASTLIVDAFSASQGKFIDDLFVDVSSNPSSTHDANAVGVLSTSKGLTLTAKPNVPSTNEDFSQWTLNGAMLTVGTSTLDLLKGANGIAIAVFNIPGGSGGGLHVAFHPNQYAIWQWVDYGTMVDGGPHPWNPLVNDLMIGVALASAAQSVHGEVRAALLQVAAKQIGLSAEAIQKSILSSGQR